MVIVIGKLIVLVFFPADLVHKFDRKIFHRIFVKYLKNLKIKLYDKIFHSLASSVY